MTYPRSQIAPPDEAGFFHVVSRCVRRAFLCGTDKYTGRCFEHRREWIEDRIRFLADSFSVAGLDASALLGMSESSYLDPVQWTGEQAHPLKCR